LVGAGVAISMDGWVGPSTTCSSSACGARSNMITST
jgi:hypothetical protein